MRTNNGRKAETPRDKARKDRRRMKHAARKNAALWALSGLEKFANA